MKKLFTILLIALLSSCSKDCKDQEDAINKAYIESLKNTHSPAAIEELKRKRDNALGALDC